MQNPPAGVRLVMEAVCIMKVTWSFFFLFFFIQIQLFDNFYKKNQISNKNNLNIFEMLIYWIQGIKPDKKLDSTGKQYEDYWPAAKRVTIQIWLLYSLI